MWLSSLRPLWTLCPAVTLILAAALLQGCASGVRDHPLDRSESWRRYEALPDERAFAISGRPDGVWVAGISGGQRSPDEAKREAIAECERQRARRRLPDPCSLYAVGREISHSPHRSRRSSWR